MDDLALRDDLSQYVESAGMHPIGDGHYMRLKFPNNFGASIIRTSFSYGGSDGLFEVAVLKFDESGTFHLCYTTELTNDVIGHQSKEEVMEILYHIKVLPADHYFDWSQPELDE